MVCLLKKNYASENALAGKESFHQNFHVLVPKVNVQGKGMGIGRGVGFVLVVFMNHNSYTIVYSYTVGS